MSNTPDAAFKALIDRILRCREVEDEAKEDTKQVYAEAKTAGYDKTALGQLVAYLRKRDKLGSEEFDARDALFQTYLSAFDGPAVVLQESVAHTHTRARVENTGEFSTETGAVH